MFRAQPKTELSKFINAYKSASSRLLKKGVSGNPGKTLERSILEPEFLPFDGRGAPVEVIRQYIETQGEKKH